jgi:protein-disulfide isomerase
MPTEPKQSPAFLAVTVVLAVVLLIVFGIYSAPPVNNSATNTNTAATTVTKLTRPTVVFGNPILGPKDAKVTIVIFGDYLCAPCATCP